MTTSVGTELLNEIERVSAIRERWRGYEKQAFAGVAFAPGIALMTMGIEQAKAAIAGNDPVASLAAYSFLKCFDDED